jgi:DNA-binding CsgD family transcriptional regulator/tetratricopeptide (TPR) repeat protein
VLGISTSTPYSARVAVPFVGNGVLVDAMAASARGATIVLGEPGAGKSRLLAEARRRRQAGGTDVFGVTCLPAAAQLPLDALIALTKSLQARGRISLRALRAVTATSESHRVQHVCEAFERAASFAPLAVQIDDLHWADPHTLQALHYCIDRLRDLPLAWNLTARPGHATCDEFGAALARAQRAVVVELDGLSANDAAVLAHALDPERSFDEGMLARLHESSGGNPLYFELLVREPDEATAPSLRRALAERLRALSPDALAFAGSIARQGGPLDAAAVAALAGLSPSRTATALAALLESRVLRRSGAGFFFRHGVLRDACHEASAETAPREPDGAHGASAHPGADTWQMQVQTAAARWEQTPDHDDMLPLLERVAAEPDAQSSALFPQVLFMLGASYEAAGELPRARDVLERALALCDAVRDEPLAVRLRARRASVEGRLGNPHEGLAMLEPVAEHAAARGLGAEAARCCADLCMLSEMIADAARYERWCRFGLEAAGAAAGSAKAELLANLARVALGKGQLREGLALAGAAAGTASEQTPAEQRARALSLQAQVNAMLGDFATARAQADEATRLAPSAGARTAAALSRGIVSELNADPKTALSAYTMAAGEGGRDAHRDAVEIGALAGIVRCACDLGLRGQAHEALEQLRGTSRLGRTLARRALHEAEGFVALLEGDVARGSEELVRATELDPEPFWHARLLLRVAAARKDRKLFLGVIESFDSMDALHAADVARTAARTHGLRPGRKREPRSALSAREGSVALLVASGMTNGEIGALLHITARTVEYHVGNILTKCGLRSRVEVATRVAAGQLDVGGRSEG